MSYGMSRVTTPSEDAVGVAREHREDCAMSQDTHEASCDCPDSSPEDAVGVAREAVLSDNCPECGHAAGWHGENHDDGCNANGHCGCGLNARDCYAKIDKAAQVDALIRAVRAECAAKVEAELAALRAKAEIVDAMERGEIRQVRKIKTGEFIVYGADGMHTFRGSTLLAAYAQARAAQEKTDGK